MISEGLRGVLIELALSAKNECILVSPFIKITAFEDIVRALGSSVTLRVYTRWRPEEVARGVSDLQVYSAIEGRPHSEFMLINSLHAKYYRCDAECFIGSANLTSRGLDGPGGRGNLELLYRLPFEKCNGFERRLDAMAWKPDQGYRDAIALAASELNLDQTHLAGWMPSVSDSDVELANSCLHNPWIPCSRSYDALWKFYIGQVDLLIQEEIRQARIDCDAMRIPLGFPEQEFKVAVHAQLLLHPLVRLLVESVQSRPRRFGHLRRICRDWCKSESVEADPAVLWQTIMRLLLGCRPDLYSLTVPGVYSEVFGMR